MWLLAVVLSVALSIFSTTVMSYIAMATPIGPWIASTVCLIAMMIFRLLGTTINFTESIALITSSASVGGIMATALGFSFPTLYFLDPALFNSWMTCPFYFVTVMTLLALVAGWYGLWIANVVEHKFIVEDELPFPVGQLVYKMIAAQKQVRKAWELAAGFISTALFCLLQDGVGSWKGILPKSFVVIAPRVLSVFRIPLVALDFWPMLWAIGFVTGHVIALPLALGALSRTLIVEPLNATVFPTVSGVEFILAFCSGMVLAGALQGMLGMPHFLWGFLKRIRLSSGFRATFKKIPVAHCIELVCVLVCAVCFLTYFEFSPATQVYLLIFSFICTYQMTLIAGKIGLAQLGRFATLVMVPALFLFNLHVVQIVMIATFVELCGGVAADILFGRKIAHMATISRAKMQAYQYLGLVVSALTVGVVFWFLINHFHLGSPALFAQKAQARQLLIDVKSFDYYVSLCGLLFGFFLKWLKLNPMFVLGGLLMPLNISIGLMIGGFASMVVEDQEAWYPFWSGVFACNSLWMIVKALW